MKNFLVCASILVLAGCGSLSKKDVPSEIVIDTPNTLEDGSGLAPRDGQELFAPEGEGELNIDTRTQLDTVFTDESESDAQQEESMKASDSVQDSVLDVTPKVVETITNKVSPVTGPAIPEEEMLQILMTK